MIIARRIVLATAASALFAILCASLGLRGVIHSELGPWASRFDAMQSMGPSSSLGNLYQRVDMTLSLFCGVAVFVAVLIALWLGHSISRRVTAVDRGLATFAAGQFGGRIEERGSDEIEHIAHNANRLAQNIEHAKDAERELVAGLAHDLAHPLTALRGSLEAARDRLIADIEPAAAERLLENVALVEATLSDLRDVSASEAGLMRLDWAPADLAEVARSAVRHYGDAARRRGLRLDHAIDGSLIVHTDLLRLQRVVANLLINAFAATQPGGVVTLRTRRERGAAVLEVEDSAGNEAAERLAAALGGEGTSGLGLRVVRTLAAAMRARITVRKTEQGSKVQIRLGLVKEAAGLPAMST